MMAVTSSLQNKNVLVLGLGISGLAMARWCAKAGAAVTVVDSRSAPPQLQTLQQSVPTAVFVSQAFTADLLKEGNIAAVFVSPGLTPAATAPVLDAARAQGVWVGGELCLFTHALAHLKIPVAPCAEASALSADDGALAAHNTLEMPASADTSTSDNLREQPYQPIILAITGTNGKTTVTSLTGQLLERAGKTVAIAGNIGPSLLDTLSRCLSDANLPEVWVLELSSFQLASTTDFAPTAATVLNITQDHLDWHGSMEAYIAAKARIFGSQTTLILNREDRLVMEFLPAPVDDLCANDKASTGKRITRKAAKAAAELLPVYATFGGDMPERPGDFGIEVCNGMAWLVRAMASDDGSQTGRQHTAAQVYIQRLMPADALRIRGRHNAVNALAALALASAAGCGLAPLLYGLRDYQGEPHRMELVAVVNDVAYYDDSKGTNVGATVAALNSLGADSRIVVVLGGQGKGQDFSPLLEPVRRYARAVILLGQDAHLIRAALQTSGVPLHDANSMPHAVMLAQAQACAGDAVLMSPACASLDMFKDYAERAQVFCDAVQALLQADGVAL